MKRKLAKLTLAKETLHALAPGSLRTLAAGTTTGNMYSCADGCTEGNGCGGGSTPAYSCGVNCTLVCTETRCTVCCHQ